ncbi:unnamed protein product, partial [Didymodactylos carnosus]
SHVLDAFFNVHIPLCGSLLKIIILEDFHIHTKIARVNAGEEVAI